MTRDITEDELTGEYGHARRSRTGERSAIPDISVSGRRGRARAAWFGRAKGAGEVRLASPSSPLNQRVIIKARVVVHAKVAGKGGGAASVMRHALYVERDGADRDGGQVHVFDRDLDKADGARFAERCANDRHHFRLILSPENGGDLESLKTFTRDLMACVESDLKTSIDWIAAEHHDTGRPHVHLLLRGVRADGRDLVIAREYISHTFRHRAEEILTRALGPRLQQGLGRELEARAARAVTLERPTHLDDILGAHARGNVLHVQDLPAERRLRGFLLQRLVRLSDWGLAEKQALGAWRLASDLKDRLTRLGDAHDRERATARLLALDGRGPSSTPVHALEGAHSAHRVTGRLVGFVALGDDASGPQLLGVDGIDGRFWTVRVARREDLRALNGVERSAIVAAARRTATLKPADRTILEIAGEARLYSPDRHRAAVPSDSAAYIQMHVRRLEALRRAGIVERSADGVFHLPPDFQAQALALEGRGGRSTAMVTLLDPHSLQTQSVYRGPTWLDRVAFGEEDMSQQRFEGFGGALSAAWEKRRETLRTLGLGEGRGDSFEVTGDYRERLAAMEYGALLQRVERETGRVPHFASDGARVEGLFQSRIHAAEQSFAIIVESRTATLVPWRPEMDRALNQLVSGRLNGRDFNFKFGSGLEKDVAKNLKRGLGIDF